MTENTTDTKSPSIVNDGATHGVEYAQKLADKTTKKLMNKMSNRLIARAINGSTVSTYVGEKVDEDEHYVYFRTTSDTEGDDSIRLLKNKYEFSSADGNAYKNWSIYPRFWEQVLDPSDLNADDDVKIVYYLGGTIKTVTGNVVEVYKSDGGGSVRLEGDKYDETVLTYSATASVYIYRLRNEPVDNPVEKIVKQ